MTKYLILFIIISINSFANEDDLNLKVAKNQIQLSKKKFLTNIPDELKVTAQKCAYYLLNGKTQFKKIVDHNIEFFQAIQNARSKYIEPTVENSIAFANLEEEYAEICPGTFHYCWGHTTTTRNFTQLAIYDQLNEFNQIVPDRKLNNKKWILFYLEKINHIQSLKPTIIPGFKNLHELSNQPELLPYFKKTVVEMWAKKAMRFRNIPILFSNKFIMHTKEANELFDEMQRQLNMGFTPKIFFTSKNASFTSKDEPGTKSIHIVNVFKIELDESGNSKIWIKEISLPAKKVKQFIRGEPDPNNKNKYNFYYDKWKGDKNGDGDESYLSEIDFTPENTFEIAQMTSNWIQFCKQNREICKKIMPDLEKRLQ